MENRIIQDYGTTINPQVYTDLLQAHPYIPQADQCALNIKKRHCQNGALHREILDLGCGPGRLTFKMADKNCHVIGLDISKSFIEFAKYEQAWNMRFPGTVSFQSGDFAKNGVSFANETDDNKFDVILMQGVMHHIHGEDRAVFFKRSFDLLQPDGILIIGDEFIKDYESDDERIMNVAKFYLHIIDEARKGGFDALACEEAKNLIDDCFSGTKFAGLATEKTFQNIYEYARTTNQMFYDYGSTGGLNFEANNQIRNMFDYIKRSVEHLTNSSAQNFNRGDLKVSLNVFLEEASLYGFKSQNIYKIGPVDQLGGMGVIVFKKQ